MKSVLFKLNNLTIAHAGHPAVHHLDGEFKAGQFTAIVGPNGGGKSTLLKALAGVHTRFEGDIHAPTAPAIAYLPQVAGLNLDVPCAVQELVAMGLWPELSWFGRLRRTHFQRIQAALARVGLVGFEKRLLSELSSGQLQRALFARLIVQNADVILLDEPFNAMDSHTQADLTDLLCQWRSEHKTVIAVLHDHALVNAHFEQTLLLARKAIAWGDTAQVLRAEQLFQARQMAQAWDSNASRCTQQAAQPLGEVA
ncbi:MAG TPA: ABC transporter ATP-binding protein [Limnobacter sp.]|nr:ABC transporter ATP-binding protein [Limnobacter sp.]